MNSIQQEILLELRNLSTVYPTKRGLVRAVDGVGFSVKRGQILGIVGESGCGKSTVLLSILRLIRRPGYIDQGQIIFRGQDLRGLSSNAMRNIRGREISMIFQDPLSTLNPAFQIGQQIHESLRLHQVIDGSRSLGPLKMGQRAREKERVLEVMTEVGIPSPVDRYTAYPHQFSGGMQQRALIAIALVCEPALLLADEPTTALDVTIQAQILDLMRRINQNRGTAIILVTHDLGLAAEFCDTIAVMYAGRIVEQGPVDDVVANPQHPYTQGLLACRPRISERGQRVQPIPGNVPDLAELPPGCPFAPRCSYQRGACDEGPIPLVSTSLGNISRCLLHVDYRRQKDWKWTDRVALEA
ncbi:MAG: ABC transporter ATP-binding protein [Anaerolineales bacterium]|nr:MAG: ABC transporter ATP-binding protein [Anaerolineales bacterium]